MDLADAADLETAGLEAAVFFAGTDFGATAAFLAGTDFLVGAAFLTGAALALLAGTRVVAFLFEVFTSCLLAV